MQVIKNYLYNAFYQLIKIIIPFITIPYLSRTLGAQGIGINSYTNSIIQYFIFFGWIGIDIYGNRKIAYVRNNRSKLSQTFYEIFIMQISMMMISYLAFLVFLYFSGSYQPFYLAQSVMIIATAFDISWFFMGIEKFKITVIRSFIVRLLILICIFLFVKTYSDLYIYILLYSTSYLLGNLTLFFSLKRYINLPKFNKLNIWYHFVPSLSLFIPEIAGQIYGVFNKNMLGIFGSVKDVGYFNQSDQIVQIVLAIVTATGTVMLPHVSNAFKNGKLNVAKNYLYDSFSLVTSLSIPIAFGISAISSKFVPLFFSNNFMMVIPLIIIESIAVILIAWSNAIGIQYLLPTKQTKLYTLSISIGAIVNIIIDIPFISLFGVFGSTVAYVIAELSVTACQLFFVRKQIIYKKLFKDIYKYIFSSIVMFIIVYLIDKVTSKSWSMIFIEVFFGIIIYVGLIFIMKSNVFIIIKRMIKDLDY